jgi:clan AA aspartic protease (TIGR02281 family)
LGLSQPAPAQNQSSNFGKSTIKMHPDDGGTFTVPALIDGEINLLFMVDSGASDVVIPDDVFSVLFRQGVIDPTSIIESKASLADGKPIPTLKFLIKSLKVGDIVINDVEASTTPRTGNPLLGRSFLSHFKSWSMDYQRGVLVLEQASDQQETPTQAPTTAAQPSAAPPPTELSKLPAQATASSATLSAYIGEVSATIRSRLFYPKAARARGSKGVVGVSFAIGPDGKMTSFVLVRSSGDPVLDAAAYSLVQSAHFPPPPGGFARISTSFNYAPR